jgi:putative oxidoreductase
MQKLNPIVYWIVRIVAAIIMVQTLYFKFSGAEESVYIFSKTGMEPWGRIVTGVFELIASVLILINSTAWLGAVLALGLMGGAILIHLTVLGIEVQGDNGYLFALALIVAICSAVILGFNKQRIFSLLTRIQQKK